LAWFASGRNFFYDKRYVATPLVAPDFAALANSFRHSRRAHYSACRRVAKIRSAREYKESVLIDFRVEQEDSVYPMVSRGRVAARNDSPPE